MPRKPLIPRRRSRTPTRVERWVGASLCVVLAGVLALFFVAGSRPPPPGLPEFEAPADGLVFPLTSPGGWPRGDLSTYDESSLFEIINGKADAYLAYAFEQLTFATYSDPQATTGGEPSRAPFTDDPEAMDDPEGAYGAASGSIDVYVYDMGTALDAYGIYRAERTGDERKIPLGDEACAEGPTVYVRKGRFYVGFEAADASDADEARALATSVMDVLPGVAAPVQDPLCFPTDGLRLVRFDRGSVLGVESLRNGYLALYRTKDATFQAFVAELDDEEEATRAARDALETFEFLGGRTRLEVRGTRVLGVRGAPSDECEDTLLAALLSAVDEEAEEGE